MTVRSSVSNGVATITLARPDRLNALDEAMTGSLLEAIKSAAEDPYVRVVILTGQGRGFCAGGDTSSTSTGRFVDLEDEIQWTRRHTEISALLNQMDKPTIAAVNGPCAGVGLSFAAACDLRIAADTAVFVTAYLGAGLPGDGGIAWTLARLVGSGRMRELMLLSPRIDAVRAAEIGLVNRVVPASALLEEVAALAEGLCSVRRDVIAAMKSDFVDADVRDLHSYLDSETSRHVRCRP